jgi:DNA-binding NarL/FixJ family response regulator
MNADNHRKPDLNNIKILVIDDNITYLNVMRNYLLRHPQINIVEIANRVASGLDLIDNFQPDIILLDLDIPEINGLDAIPLIRYQGSQLPIIILSMLDSKPYQNALIKAGANAFVSKNTMGEELIPTIFRLLENNIALE